MAIPKNITSEKQTEILNALNRFFDREYDYVYDVLSDAVDANGIIGIAYTEYEEDDECHDYDTIQVSYDLNTEEYVYIYGDKGGMHEKRESMDIDCFIKDLEVCCFDDFLYFD